MSNTSVLISPSDGILFPAPDSVSFSNGDSVTFSAAPGVSASLFFSPDAAGILSPQPTNAVALAAGTSVTFTFTGSGPGAFYAFLAMSGVPVEEFPLHPTGNVLKVIFHSLRLPEPTAVATTIVHDRLE